MNLSSQLKNEIIILANDMTTTKGTVTTFGDIALASSLKRTTAGAIVGYVVNRNKEKIPYWYRIVSKSNCSQYPYHPIADKIVLEKLESEGWSIDFGKMSK